MDIFSRLALLVFVILIVSLTVYYLRLRQRLMDDLRQIDKLIQNPGQARQQKNNLIPNIEGKAYQAFTQQEKINTLAIIDKAWSQDLSPWERDYRFCLGLPGVLLAVGLLGTFFGITINLFILGIKFNSASQIVVEDLQEALGGMAIAFASSLFALGCNVGLTVYKPSHNLTLKKEEVISSLEFYIDNVYIPGLQPRRPMFHEAVGELRQIVNNDLRSLVENALPNAVASAVSLSLRQNIQEIRNDQKTFLGQIHKEVQDLIEQARQAHIKITQSSTLIEQGAEHFKEAAQQASATLASGSDNFQRAAAQASAHFKDAAQQASDTLASGSDNFQRAAAQASASLESATANLQGVQRQYSQSAASLNASAQSLSASVQSIAGTMATFQSYTNELQRLQQAVRDLENIAKSLNGQLSNVTATLKTEVESNSKELRDLAGQTKKLAQRVNDLLSRFNNP